MRGRVVGAGSGGAVAPPGAGSPAQDRLPQPVDGLARRQARLAGQTAAQLGVAVERLRRPAQVMQRAHVRHPQPLAQRMGGDQRREFAHQQAVLTEVETRLQVLLDRGQPLLLQPGDRGPYEGFTGEVRERRPPPQRQRVREGRRPGARVLQGAGVRDQGPEPPRVDGVRRGPQHIAGGLAHDQVAGALLGVLQGAAQLGDLRLQRGGGAGGRRSRPQRLDQPGRGDHPAVAGDETGQQGADLELRHPDRSPRLRAHFQRAQHPESHGVTVTRRSTRSGQQLHLRQRRFTVEDETVVRVGVR
ncbi:hypothetical protein RKD49_006097 [Streptomyces glaucescens]